MRRLLLFAVFAALAGCQWSSIGYGPGGYPYPVLTDENIAALHEDAADALRCPGDKVESRYYTMLTRVVRGCGHEAVFAYDAQRDDWVLQEVEGR